MSKTKEEVLQTALDHCQTYPSPVQRTFIYKAMDEYAQQAVSEYKEKLTKRLQVFSSDKHGRIFTTEVIELNETL